MSEGAHVAANSPREVIALKDVTVTRGGRDLLRRVDWTVREHERWVVLGPNGAGKTTLLQVVSTYLAPSRGTVRVLGATRGQTDVRDLREHIGYAGPAPMSMIRGYLPAVEIVVTGKHATFVGSRWDDYEESDWDRANELLERLDAGHLSARDVGTLSAGERQRVLIARSLMPNPALLLLDEAATGLDLGAREGLVASLANLAADPDSPVVVMVTHHVEEVPPGFTHILLVRDGEVVGRGPIEEELTSATLTDCFGVDLALDRHLGRFRAWRPG